MTSDRALRRQLGFAAVAAVVAGDMLGSGIFFTPGELASVARVTWHVYFFWALCGFITLCGALTLAELATLFPRSGATYHIIREAFGPFWGFLKIWVEMWVSGPGSVAGVAIVFGTFLTNLAGGSTLLWGAAAIAFFSSINLLGIRWGGRTQIVLTSIKIIAILALVFGSIFVAPAVKITVSESHTDWLQFIQLIGLGVAAVLFTYDGWVDVTHVAGEVAEPSKNLPGGLFAGVGAIIVLYLIVNYAFLRVVPLQAMRSQPTLVASHVANAAFGRVGGQFLNALIMLSIFGALGGLIMTLPRLYFAAAAQYQQQNPNFFFFSLSYVSKKSTVPAGSILFCAVISTVALIAFRSFSRLASFFIVSEQFINILMVASIYRLRKQNSHSQTYRTPAYPVTPLIFIVVMSLLLISAIYYRPIDTLIGAALTATSFPVYFWLKRRSKTA